MPDPTEEELKNELLAAILAAMPIAYDPAIHVTAQQFAQRTGMSTNSARDYLDNLVKHDPALERVMVRLPNGRAAWAVKRK